MFNKCMESFEELKQAQIDVSNTLLKFSDDTDKERLKQAIDEMRENKKRLDEMLGKYDEPKDGYVRVDE